MHIYVYMPLTTQIQDSGNDRRIVYLSSLQLICINLALQVKQDSAEPHGPKGPKQGPCRQPLALSHAGLPTQWPHDHAAMPGHDSPRDQSSSLSQVPSPVAGVQLGGVTNGIEAAASVGEA